MADLKIVHFILSFLVPTTELFWHMALTLPDLRKARKTKSIVYLKLYQDRSLVYRKKNPHFPYYDRYLLKLCILIPGGKGFERGGGEGYETTLTRVIFYFSWPHR